MDGRTARKLAKAIGLDLEKVEKMRGGDDRSVSDSMISLDPVYRRIVELYSEGFKKTEIAEIMGRTQVTVQNVLQNPMAQSYLTYLESVKQKGFAAVAERQVGAAARAQVILENLMDDDEQDSGLRAKIAMNQQDRVQGKPHQTVYQNKSGVVCNVHFIEEVKKRALEELKRNGKVHQEEVEEVEVVDVSDS